MSWVYSFLTNSIIKLIAFALALKPKDSLGTRLPPTHTPRLLAGSNDSISKYQGSLTHSPNGYLCLARSWTLPLQRVMSGGAVLPTPHWCLRKPMPRPRYFRPFFWQHWGFQLAASSLKSTLCRIGALPTLPSGLTCVVATFGLHLLLPTVQRPRQWHTLFLYRGRHSGLVRIRELCRDPHLGSLWPGYNWVIWF